MAWLKVPQPEPEPLSADAQPVNAVIADSFALTGTEMTRTEDGTLTITLAWKTLAAAPLIDATVFVHALNADGAMIAQSDIRPANGAYPTFIWSVDERVHTTHVLPLGTIDAETVRLVAGMYTFPGPTRLSARQDGDPAPDDLIELGTP